MITVGSMELCEVGKHRNLWIATPDRGTTIEDMVKPHYWKLVAAHLKPWDIIEVRGFGAMWWAELVVRDAGHTAATVEVMRHIDFYRRGRVIESVA